MLLDVALDEQGAALRVEPRRDPVGEHLALRLGDVGGVLVLAGERVPVRGEEEALGLAADLDPVLHRAVVVPEVQAPGGAHTRDHAAWLALGGRV